MAASARPLQQKTTARDTTRVLGGQHPPSRHSLSYHIVYIITRVFDEGRRYYSVCRLWFLFNVEERDYKGGRKGKKQGKTPRCLSPSSSPLTQPDLCNCTSSLCRLFFVFSSSSSSLFCIKNFAVVQGILLVAHSLPSRSRPPLFFTLVCRGDSVLRHVGSPGLHCRMPSEEPHRAPHLALSQCIGFPG